MIKKLLLKLTRYLINVLIFLLYFTVIIVGGGAAAFYVIGPQTIGNIGVWWAINMVLFYGGVYLSYKKVKSVNALIYGLDGLTNLNLYPPYENTLLFILIAMPFIGISQGCGYGSSADASELCNFYSGNRFTTDRDAEIAFDKILGVTGMSKRFVLKECNDIANCVAISYNGIRYILYDKKFYE